MEGGPHLGGSLLAWRPASVEASFAPAGSLGRSDTSGHTDLGRRPIVVTHELRPPLSWCVARIVRIWHEVSLPPAGHGYRGDGGEGGGGLGGEGRRRRKRRRRSDVKEERTPVAVTCLIETDAPRRRLVVR